MRDAIVLECPEHGVQGEWKSEREPTKTSIIHHRCRQNVALAGYADCFRQLVPRRAQISTTNFFPPPSSPWPSQSI